MNYVLRGFGENASLDPATQADILRFLEANAADSGRSRMGNQVMQRMGANEAPLRITETRWFVREHDEVPRAAWTRKSVGSAANCAALPPAGGERCVQRTRHQDSSMKGRDAHPAGGR